MAMTNRYPGKCACGAKVAAGAGFAYKKNGAWLTCCSSAACGRAAGIDTSPASVARTLSAVGGILMVHTPPPVGGELALLRALPGARWDAAAKGWHCSAASRDRARVLEIADQLRLDVPAELREIHYDAPTVAAAARSEAAGLYPYQRDGVRWLASRDRALLADDMGLGKTVQVLCALPERARVLVVCPAVVKYVWRDEAKRWRPEYGVTIAKGRAALPLPAEGEIVVVNPESLPPALADEEKAEALLAEWKAAGVVLVCDEAHAYKSHKARRTQAIRALSGAASKTWFLTGTPLLGRPMDLFGVLSSAGLDREALGGWKGFLRLFNGYKSQYGYEFGTPGPEVAERLRRCMLRRTKAEVLPDLPAVTYQTITVNDLPDDLVEDLDEAWERWGDEDLDFGAAGKRRSLPDIREFSALRRRLAESRIPALLEIVTSHEEQGIPLLVFSAHRAPVDTVGAREGWAAITGDTSPEARADIVRRFQGGELRGVALTIQAGGVGLTLTRASNVVFADLDWTPALNAQAEDRVRRIGQKADKIHVTRLVGSHVLDQHVLAILDQKMALIRAAIEAHATVTERASTTWTEETDEARAKRIEDAAAKAEVDEARAALESVKTRVAEHVAAHHGGRKIEALTEEQAEAAEEAMLTMLGRCDGAVTKDEMGFNRAHAGWARKVYALVTHGDGGEKREALCVLAAILRCYPGQLRGGFPALWERQAA